MMAVPKSGCNIIRIAIRPKIANIKRYDLKVGLCQFRTMNSVNTNIKEDVSIKNKNVKLSILLSWIEIIVKIPIFAIAFVMWIGNNKTISLQNNAHFDKLDEEE